MRLLTLTAAALLLAAPLTRADDRKPPPDADAQAKAETQIKDLFKEDFAKRKPADRQALAAKLVQETADADNDAPRKFVLLRLASEVAARAGDVAAALHAIDAQAQEFTIDAPALKAVALDAALHATGGAQPDYQAILDAALELADEAKGADDYDAAGRLLHTAQSAATKLGSSPAATAAAERGRLVDAMQKEYENVRGDFATLKDKPDDPDASLHVGRFLCFYKGDWEKGLPLLAQGGDAKLKELAKRDLNPRRIFVGDGGNFADASDQADLADAWFEVAEVETGPKAVQIQLHARGLYKAAVLQLSGPTRAKVDERLKKLDKIAEKLTIPEGKAAASDAGWFVLFRSADPSLWDTDTDKGKNNFAVSLSKAPDGVKFLRLKLGAAGDYVIIPMTNDALKKQGDDGTFGWEGEGAAPFLGGGHLGIYRLPLGAHPRGEVAVYHVAVGMNATGWGFGHLTGIGTVQGYGWAGKALPSTVFEIAVKAGPLTEAETKHLLGKKGK